MSTNENVNTQNGDHTFNEAPASWNTRYVHPSGFECQITLRGDSGGEVLTKAQKATEWLLEHDCKPLGSNGHGFSHEQTNCPMHNVTMKR